MSNEWRGYNNYYQWIEKKDHDSNEKKMSKIKTFITSIQTSPTQS